MHLKIRSLIAALLLMVSPLVLISKANAMDPLDRSTQSFDKLFMITNSNVSESVLITYGLAFPGQSGEGSPLRFPGTVQIEWRNSLSGADGNPVAEFSNEVPIFGFGEVEVSVTDVTAEDAQLVINGINQEVRIPVTNHRFALRFTFLAGSEGRNPATGEVLKIPARRAVYGTITVVGADRTTKSTDIVVPGDLNDFQFTEPL